MRWREIDLHHFGELMRRAVADALGPRTSARRIEAIAHLLAGAFVEAALVSATADEPGTVARDLLRGMETLLKNLDTAAAR